GRPLAPRLALNPPLTLRCSQPKGSSPPNARPSTAHSFAPRRRTAARSSSRGRTRLSAEHDSACPAVCRPAQAKELDDGLFHFCWQLYMALELLLVAVSLVVILAGAEFF